MRPDSEKSLLKTLENRINLLSRGIILPDESVPVVHIQSTRGGAGPQGVVCHIGDAPGKNNSQISLVIYPKNHYMAQYALSTKWWEEDLTKGAIKNKKKILHTENNIFIEEVLPNWQGIADSDLIIKRSLRARLHPYHTYSTCLYRSCRHLENDMGCRFQPAG